MFTAMYECNSLRLYYYLYYTYFFYYYYYLHFATQMYHLIYNNYLSYYLNYYCSHLYSLYSNTESKIPMTNDNNYFHDNDYCSLNHENHVCTNLINELDNGNDRVQTKFDICFINVGGLSKKSLYPEFNNFLEGFEIVCLAETKCDSTLSLPKFELIHKVRKKYKRRGKGVIRTTV